MTSLSKEEDLDDIRRSIANIMFGPQPVNHVALREQQRELDELHEREADLEEELGQVPYDGNYWEYNG